MHDTLFTNQRALELSDLLAYADDIGLDRRRFTRDLQEHRFLPKVRRDFMEGVRSGVNGTPTIFINGERWNGPYTAAALLAGIRGNRSPDVEPMTQGCLGDSALRASSRRHRTGERDVDQKLGLESSHAGWRRSSSVMRAGRARNHVGRVDVVVRGLRVDRRYRSDRGGGVA
jgi:hypothetical protein